MKVVVSHISSWLDVLNCARVTRRKSFLTDASSVSDAFKRMMVRSEHSPLRALLFTVDMYDIPYYVAMHFRTHKLVHLPLVSTGRPDIDGNQVPRCEQKKDDLVNMRLLVDAQELIAISRVRLCRCAEESTRRVWRCVVDELSKIEPLLACACVETCVYRGWCSEAKCCGYSESRSFGNRVLEYRESLR